MSLDVRIRLDHFDFAHPAEKQVQIFVTVPDVVRVSYLLPERFWDELRDEEWIDALNAAHDYFEQNVWGDTGAEEKKRLREWLAVDEHVDALHAAWFEDRARRDPVSRALLKDKERLTAELRDERELVAAMHAASVGCSRVPLLGFVADVAETRAAYLAQQHRADGLDVALKRALAEAAAPCRCFSAEMHEPACAQSRVLVDGVEYSAVHWYTDEVGDLWVPVGFGHDGALLLRLLGDPAYDAVPLGELVEEHGPLTRTEHSAGLSFDQIVGLESARVGAK